MKRILVYFLAVLPWVALGLWSLPNSPDPRFAAPLFHFYIVVFTTFTATVLSLLIAFSVGQTALARHLFLAMAFAWMGAVFFIHGASTPGALITHFHPAITWSAWLTMFGGGLLFAAGAFAPNAPHPRLLALAASITLTLYAAYVGVVLFFSDVLSALLAPTLNPQARDIAFGFTLLIWVISGLRHLDNYRHTRHTFDALMAFEAVWFAAATISLFQFPLWNSSWWLYHVLLLAGFVIAGYSLWRAYEQLQTFRLSRYYLATSLIATAALALFSAQLYAQVSFDTALRQAQSDTARLSRQLAATGNLQQAQSDFQILTQLNAAGEVVFTTAPAEASFTLSDELREELRAVTAGETIVEVIAPGEALDGYAIISTTYLIQTYLPFAPADVLLTVRAMPELTEVVILARRMGLLLSGLTLGGLFLVLFSIVRRADQLITQRSRELEAAYTDLSHAQELQIDLTNMIVHDLRNPLTAVTANLDLLDRALRQPTPSHPPTRFLVSARGAGQRMLGLIDDLLNVSKFEAGELRPMLAPVDIAAFLAERAGVYQQQAEREEKTFALQMPPTLPTLPLDVSLLGRVLDNLMSNAFKYTDKGGHIDLSAQLEANALRLSVRDNGEGIALEYHARIFDKFMQVVDEQGRPLRKGTGLGLAFCRLAVEAHGGRIGVESQLKQGSTFYFTLPLK